ncbi:MAG: restriction endonuclease subunit S [Oscillospiraceae bacterium]|nr:restriction endonuclease subunit S [Oscillospiraceae bacterium]
MTPQELKSSILQLAIQGKLVEQRPEEGTVEELYKQIQAEKQALIRAGKTKKEKPLPEITENEIPFEIPESWKWVYIGDIFLHNTGKAQNASGSTSGTIRKFITTSNLYWGCFDFSKVKEMPFTEQEIERCSTRKGDLLVCEGGDCGRSAIWAYDEEVCIQNHVHRLRPYYELSIEYYYYMFYLYKFTGRLRGHGVAIQGLSSEAIHKVICPLPPLAEQKRIVAKIEELLPLIDRYEKAWSRLEDFNKRFPVDMQKSILQMAIQGKLVEQRPEEGTGEELYRQIQAEKQALVKAGKIKKEKPLPEISEAEIPFEIPESWKWVRFSNVVDVRDGTHDTPKYVASGIPLVTSKNLLDGKIDFETAKDISIEDATAINMRSHVDDGDILFAMIGTIGNPVLVKKDREFCIKNMALFKQIDASLLDMRYVLLFLQKAQTDMKAIANASVQSFVSLNLLRNYLFPLPPLAEQKRIVARLEELLPLCERLK